MEPDGTVQIVPPRGCHSFTITNSSKLESSTKVLRSMGLGKYLAKKSLNDFLAIMLCCNPKSKMSPAFVNNAIPNETLGGPSMDISGIRLPIETIQNTIAPNAIR